MKTVRKINLPKEIKRLDFSANILEWLNSNGGTTSFERLNGNHKRSFLYKIICSSTDAKYVLRVFSTRQNEKQKKMQFVVSKKAGDIGVSPKIIYHDKNNYNFFISEYLDTKKLTSEDLEQPPLLAESAKLIYIVHENFHISKLAIDERPVLFSEWLTSIIRKINENKIPMPSVFESALEDAYLLQRLFFSDEKDLVLCHGDLHHNNFLLTYNNKLKLIDWETCGIRNRFLELAQLTYFFSQDQEINFLKNYFVTRDYSISFLWAKLRLAKILLIFYDAIMQYAYTSMYSNSKYKAQMVNNNSFYDTKEMDLLYDNSDINFKKNPVSEEVYSRNDISDKEYQKIGTFYMKYFISFMNESLFAKKLKSIVKCKIDITQDDIELLLKTIDNDN